MLFTPWTILILAAFGLTMWAQFRVKGTFSKYSEVPVSSGMTGAEAARHLLDSNGLSHIPVEHIPGTLTDHYDPMSKTVRLSDPVYFSDSISAVSVACHEVGHAIQHKVDYPMLVARHRIFPLVNLTSGVAPFLLLGGLFLKISGLFLLGIIAFSVAVLFQVITLPVEFNASSRARDLMIKMGYIRNSEEREVKAVLGAAALTYVAAALMSVLQLLEYIWLFKRDSDD
ncbi:zinc metallopeptidase [Brevibacillus sp. 7WMA2]|mgnify:CR=1 FL=1|uniref:Putative neutral zinc metallopeptidase n=1 Tax=Brevibacillus laterosporus LMG 15441 TaxID=1042163 RepID=A0A075QZR6_BRELA|nr:MULTISPECIES: zinc metallopeptidase [Brevibacillus]AIG25094.1 putative neutral zinc metallopeptidase [Brevibacillus laterosporus LMG 15441]AUM63709.1 peptidase [Brevibacillus laterosporus]AYK06713.1 zinc metallopeptidase [Brevibacillus laterosporus]ERM17625.1 zinc metallopeptidase [Brevibacillus laterosporus PE36]MBA4534687.1 zinc metallopeptidase [Brevibacillus halotolerans]